jgi:hypothetical protein
MEVRELAGLLAILSLSCSSFGLAVGSLFPHSDVALAVGPAITIVYVILGVFGPAGINGEKLPRALKPFRLLSPMRWACEALCLAEFQGRRFESPVSPTGGTGHRLRAFAQRISRRIAAPLIGILRRGNARPVLTDGDRVVRDLGVLSPSKAHAAGMLSKLLIAHMTVALLGLIFQKKSG